MLFKNAVTLPESVAMKVIVTQGIEKKKTQT